MYKVHTLFLSPDYNDKLIERNRDLVGFVIERKTGRVKNTAIVTRGGLADWYQMRRAQYAEDTFELVLGTISIMGVVRGTDIKDVAVEDPAEIKEPRFKYRKDVN